MLKGLNSILVALAMIALIGDFQVAGLPRPQQEDDSFTFVDGFAFDGTADRMLPIANPTGPSQTLPTARPDPVTSPAGTGSSGAAAPEVTRCTQNCRFQVTAEYNPVCGTDQNVYANPGMLACAKNCGLDVEHSYFGPCTSNIRG